MVNPWSRLPAGWLLLAAAVGAISPATRAQLASLPFDLVDVAKDAQAPDFCGIDFQYVDLISTVNEDVGGVSIADFDNDGWLDVFLPNNKGSPNKLWRNQGNGSFVDVAPALGADDSLAASSVGLFIDYDHDGDLDLFVACHMGTPTNVLGPAFRLLRNDGAAGGYHFSNVTASAGFVFGPTTKSTLWGWVSGACAGDYDHDGWPDLFISWNGGAQSQDQWRLMRNVPNPTPGNPLDPNYTPRIYVDATPGSGLEGEFGGNPWQPMFWDVNRDDWPDIHIAQDNTLDVMFINNHDGTFTNVATAAGLNGDPPDFRNEMGTALGDPDNDLDLDLHTTNILNEDRFYRNDSVGSVLSFTDIAVESGLDVSRFGWGTSFFDLDNDGDVDHADVTGFEHDLTQVYINPVQLNLFPELLPGGIGVKWADISALVPDFSKVGTPSGDSARGLAAGDLDGDGDMDCIVTRNLVRTAVYENTLVSDNRWLEVDLINSGGSLDTTGSRVYVSQGGRLQFREVLTGSSFLCQESPRLHFGLGPAPGGDQSFGSSGPAGFGGSTSIAHSATSAAAGAPSMPGNRAQALASGTPAWLVVRWPDGAYQIVKWPLVNRIMTVSHTAVNAAGDMNADGHLTAADQAMLLLATQDASAFAVAYPLSPGLVVGDIDGNGVLDAGDYAAWSSLPPH